MADILEEGLKKLAAPGLNLGEKAPLFRRYIAEIELFNPAYGLVKVRNREELVVKHLLDSLAPLPLLIPWLGLPREGLPRIADVGSGAGLPGVPLAIALPDYSFTLIERMGRRAGFLRNVLAALGLGNCSVEEGEMEKVSPGRFALVAFRAFRPLEPRVFRGLLRLPAPGGVLAAWKGRQETAFAEMSALETARPDLRGRWELFPLQVPLLDEERCLVIIGGRAGLPRLLL